MHRQEIFRAAEPDGVLFPPVIVPPGALLLFDCDDVDFVRDGGAEDLSMLTYKIMRRGEFLSVPQEISLI